MTNEGQQSVQVEPEGPDLPIRASSSGTRRALGVEWRTAFLIESIGSRAALARLLDVSRSQPTRWLAGEETPGPENMRALIDLDYVVARAEMVWPPDVALEWLEGANSYLDGARPIDVLKLRGPTEVIDALDAALSGSFS